MPDPRKLVTPLLEQLLKPIRTYHASPHDFDKFDISKIGTGQGAAMYSPGIYTAESPAVSGLGGAYWREFAERPEFVEGPQSVALHYLRTYNFDRAKAAAAAWDAAGEG